MNERDVTPSGTAPNLDGRAVLVTGGSMGIGLAVARALAAQGARLALVARGAEALEAARSSLPGIGHTALSFDVSDESAWAGAIERVGRVDGLICAAAVIEPIGAVGTYPPGNFRRTLEINLFGTYLAIHHCLPSLRAKGGTIVTFGGGGATAPLPRYDAYAASKAAVVRLTENLAGPLAEEGVMINCVAPGFVATRMHDATFAAGADRAGRDYFERTRQSVEDGGFPAAEAAELVCLLAGGVPFTGKLVSAQWDPWRDPRFHERLAAERPLGTLRRIDAVQFASVGTGT